MKKPPPKKPIHAQPAKRAGKKKAKDAPPALDDVIATGQAAKARLDDDWYTLSASIRDVIDLKLWEQKKDQYKNAYDCIEQAFGVKPSQGKKYATVARAFQQKYAESYHFESLSLLESISIAGHLTLPADPGPMPITFEEKGARKTLPFSQCTARQLESALELVKSHGGSGGAMPAADQKELKYLQGEIYDFSGDRATHITGAFRNGETRVSLENARLADFRDICQQLGTPDAPSGKGHPPRKKK